MKIKRYVFPSEYDGLFWIITYEGGQTRILSRFSETSTLFHIVQELNQKAEGRIVYERADDDTRQWGTVCARKSSTTRILTNPMIGEPLEN